MLSRPFMSTRSRRGIAFALTLALAGAVVVLIEVAGGSRLSAQPASALEATIFSYDGHDFVRTHTTLLNEAGKSAVNTKLDRESGAYKALVMKHSYTGDGPVFGKRYNARYAPLTDQDGRLTGALFVGSLK